MLYNFFLYPYYVFFETIHSYSFGFNVYFYLFINIVFLHSLFSYTEVSLEY